MAQKQAALGKGLASLFPGVVPSAPQGTSPSGTVGATPPSVNQVLPAGATVAGPATTVPQQESAGARIPGISLAMVDEILTNQYQPRHDFDETALEELAASIRVNGIIQPLVVRRTNMGSFELIAGERRLRAAKKAGLKQVPVVIRRSTDKEALELALIENIQRQDLNCVDEALAYNQLVQEFNLTQEEVAQRVGKERATVANSLRLLKLSDTILDDLRKGILSFGHGKILLSLEDADLRLRARQQIVEHRLSVRETERLVETLKRAATSQTLTADAAPAPEATPLQNRFDTLSQDLTRKWSAKIELKGSERRGKIIFHYATREELERLIEAMQNQQI